MKYFSFLKFLFYNNQFFYFPGCGACNVSKKQPISPNVNFVTYIRKDGRINGLVPASCGVCNFGMKDKKRCRLVILINDITYDVKVTGIDDHGNSHAKMFLQQNKSGKCKR